MRVLILVMAMLAGSLTSASAADYFWISSITDTGSFAALVGCKDCDDYALRLQCNRQSKTVRISLYSNYAASKPQGKKADLVRFHFGEKKAVRSAAMEFDEMNGAWLPVITVNARSPLLRRIMRFDSLAIDANGRKVDISMNGAAKHIKKMRRGCL